jgi:hypothetical protein
MSSTSYLPEDNQINNVDTRVYEWFASYIAQGEGRRFKDLRTKDQKNICY